MSINRIELLNHSFSRSIRGYDPQEVDTLLHDAADSIARLSDERVRLLNQVTQLEERLTDYAARETVLRNTLIASQRVADDIREATQKEAQAILEAAHNRAESLANQANLRLARVLDEISDARKLKAQFEFKVRSVIESHLKLLEMSQAEDARMGKTVAAIAHRALENNRIEE
jgi:cell division initiation protein